MIDYCEKTVIIGAIRWFKNGDHPKDNSRTLDCDTGSFLSEGKVVRRYRRPDVDGNKKCQHCGISMSLHGWIDNLESGHDVCPGDWIITGVNGEHYPCKPDDFYKNYKVNIHDNDRKKDEY